MHFSLLAFVFSTNDISFFSVVGWAGHTNNNFLSNEDVAQIFEKVRSHKSKTISVDNVLLSKTIFLTTVTPWIFWMIFIRKERRSELLLWF